MCWEYVYQDELTSYNAGKILEFWICHYGGHCERLLQISSLLRWFYFAKIIRKTQMDSKAKTDVINSVTSCYNKNIL